LGNLQRLLLGGDDVVQDDLQLVLGAQLEIVRCELGLGGETRARQLRLADLKVGATALRAAADPSPQIDVPAAGNAGAADRGGAVGVVFGGAGGGVAGPLAPDCPYPAAAQVDLGPETRLRLAHERAGFLHPGRGRLDVLVRDVELRLETVQH